jgi:hypothetical protein
MALYAGSRNDDIWTSQYFEFDRGIIKRLRDGYQSKKITIPTVLLGEQVSAIGDRAFSKNQLTSVTIPDSVTFIGAGAFSENQLTSVSVPKSTVVERGAFDRKVKIKRR